MGRKSVQYKENSTVKRWKIVEVLELIFSPLSCDSKLGAVIITHLTLDIVPYSGSLVSIGFKMQMKLIKGQIVPSLLIFLSIRPENLEWS